MNHSSPIPPRSPFSTRLSGSARETELRMRSIFQWKKKRPPVWLMVLTAALILSCGSLVSCRSRQDTPPDVSTPLSDEAASPTFFKEVTLSDGSQFLFRTEEDPSEASFDGFSSWLYWMDNGTEHPVTSVPYGPEHHYWESIALDTFSDVMGRSGFTLSYDTGAAWHSVFYYAMDQGYPEFIAGCYNTVWTEDLDGDGRTELLSNYHTQGYLDVHWAAENAANYSAQLNETARRMLNLPSEVWVNLNALARQEDGVVVACWTQDDVEHTQELELAKLWQFELAQSSRTDVRTLRTASGRELTVVLEEQNMEGEYLENWYQVTSIRVYDGESLIQTIDPASLEWPQPDSPDNGLYVMGEHDYMEPQVLDLNADGSEDLGVMAELLPPKSPSFAWFLWDEDREQLVLSAWLSDFLITARRGTYSLSPDLEFYCNFYTYNTDGTWETVQERQPYRPLIPDDSRPFVWAELYQVTRGKEIFFGQVLQPTD